MLADRRQIAQRVDAGPLEAIAAAGRKLEVGDRDPHHLLELALLAGRVLVVVHVAGGFDVLEIQLRPLVIRIELQHAAETEGGRRIVLGVFVQQPEIDQGARVKRRPRQGPVRTGGSPRCRCPAGSSRWRGGRGPPCGAGPCRRPARNIRSRRRCRRNRPGCSPSGRNTRRGWPLRGPIRAAAFRPLPAGRTAGSPRPWTAGIGSGRNRSWPRLRRPGRPRHIAPGPSRTRPGNSRRFRRRRPGSDTRRPDWC